MNISDNSEWALSYLLIWDSHLTDDELKIVSSSLNTFLNNGIPIKFNSSSLYNKIKDTLVQKQQIDNQTYIDKYKNLNLTDIQKKMLL